MTDLWQMGAVELANKIASREASAREVVEAHLARIEAVNPALNAVTRVLADEALASAEAADAAVARGDELGALHGVPMSVKENVDCRGSATTQGVRAMKDAVPDRDAPHLEQLRRAGAIPVARTNLPDFGLRWMTENDLHGATRNPWDAARSPGGSSGGDAVALATGMVPLGNGNDYGGSLRIPSQYCGTVALKPTLGRVAQHHSLAPADPGLTLQLFAVQGPMARHVADLRAAFANLCGPDARDPWWTPAPLEGPAPERPIRVGMIECPAGGRVAPEVATGVQRAAEALSDAGYAVEPISLPEVSEAADVWRSLVFTEIRNVMLPVMRPLLSKGAARFLDLGLETEPESGLLEYAAAMSRRLGLARAFGRQLAQTPLLLGPVSNQPPFPLGADIADSASTSAVIESMRLVVSVNLLGLPAAAVPAGLECNRPQGVQIIGDRYREDLCLDAAEAVEARLGIPTPIDPR